MFTSPLFTVKPSQASPPQESINEFIIQKLNPLVVVFQIDFCTLACVMSREFTREAVMKFLLAPFS